VELRRRHRSHCAARFAASLVGSEGEILAEGRVADHPPGIQVLGYDDSIPMLGITFPRVIRLVCRSALAAGIGFCLLALGSEIYFAYFLSHSLSASARITSNGLDVSDGENYYCPEYRFEAADGITYTVTSHVCSNPPEYAVGQVVLVRYKSNDPSDAYIDSFLHNGPRTFAIWGVCALCVGFAFGWYERRRGINIGFRNR